MIDRPCIRCQHPVLLEDGHLVYCSQCGAPQIFLSEELQSELAESARAYNERRLPGTEEPAESPTSSSDTGQRWSPLRRIRAGSSPNPTGPWGLGVQYALLSAGVTLALGLASLVLPVVTLLLLLWVIGAPIVTVAFFQGQSGDAPPADLGFTARLGLLTGLLVTFCCALVFTLSLVLTRFVFHDAAVLDSQLAASFAQQKSLVLSRLGTGVQPALDLFTVPEYRVGLLLSVSATSAAVYLVLSTLAGGIAGLLLRRRRV